MSFGVFNHNYLIWQWEKILLEWRNRRDIVFLRWLKTKNIKFFYILATLQV
ncbi:Uncharacterised protein [Serratia entomophila]|nr:Uncharacterised protein [Serratia entomophila]CAI1085532.1 Uncharacterised protein [Serratia entomophila]CAI2134909.1 Uncharacterised protein [Serratia entomophila]